MAPPDGRYALNSLWHLEAETPLLRGYNVGALFEGKLRSLPKPLHKRLKYYRSYLDPQARTAPDGAPIAR